MNKLTNRTRNNEDDSEEFSSEKKVQWYKRAHPSFELVVNVFDSIREPAHYFDLIQEMEELSEEDIVEFRIASGGGRLDGLVALLNAIKMTDAPVIGTLCGEAASAASILFLSCDGCRVLPNSTMMIHSASFGYVSHQSNMVSQATFVDKQARKILTEAYQDFLSSEELREVFHGKELWLDYDEINERLEKRDEIRKARYEQEHGEIDLNDLEED